MPKPRVNGGTWAKGGSKSGLEWSIYRAAQLPGPEYDTDAVHKYMEGKSGTMAKGARILGREGYNLPFPLNQYYAGTSAVVRGTPSGSHGATLTPWRRPDSEEGAAEPAEAAAAAEDSAAAEAAVAEAAVAEANSGRWRRARGMAKLLMVWADSDGDGLLARSEFDALQVSECSAALQTLPYSCDPCRESGLIGTVRLTPT